MRAPCLLFFMFFLFTASPVLAEESIVLAPRGGGEIRMVVCDGEIPVDLTATGLVRFDEYDALVASLADTWTTSGRGYVWSFHLLPDARLADGEALSETDIMASLKSPRTKPVLAALVKKIQVSSDSIVFTLRQRDPSFARRLAQPPAAILLPGRAATGPFRVLRRETDHAVLVPNPHSRIPVRPETLVLLFEPDVARGVFLVEAGTADIAPVGDDDIARLRAHELFHDRVVYGATRRVHAFVSRRMPHAQLLLLRRAIDRATIARMLLNGRADPLGPAYRPLSASERTRLPSSIRIAERIGRTSSRRILPRIAYDLRRSGLSCEIVGPDHGHAMMREYAEGELPADAVPLLDVKPCWLVHPRVKNFIPPRDGRPGVLFAESRP